MVPARRSEKVDVAPALLTTLLHLSLVLRSVCRCDGKAGVFCDQAELHILTNVQTTISPVALRNSLPISQWGSFQPIRRRIGEHRHIICGTRPLLHLSRSRIQLGTSAQAYLICLHMLRHIQDTIRCHCLVFFRQFSSIVFCATPTLQGIYTRCIEVGASHMSHME